MSRAVWDNLLAEARAVHQRHPALQGFCPFPDHVTAQEVEPYDIPGSALMAADEALVSRGYGRLTEMFRRAAPLAHWRETYKGTGIGRDFLDRFA